MSFFQRGHAMDHYCDKTELPGGVRVITRGQVARYTKPFLASERDPHKRCCLVVPASTSQDRGFQTVAEADFENAVYADGVVLKTPSTSAVMQTADCPTIVLSHPPSGRVVFAHAGRWALTPGALHPGACTDCTANIVTTALRRLLGNEGDVTAVHVFITASISSQNFRHNDAYGRELIGPFLSCFGESVFDGDIADGCLNQHCLIRRQLTRAGVPSGQIAQDDTCTFEHPGLASHRQHTLEKKVRTTANAVVVSLA